MTTFRSFEDIEAWRKARELVKAVYDASGKGAFAKDYPLRDQVRRAATSVMSNIAEGFDRGGSAEFRQFLAVAKASAAEVRSHLYVALDQGYVSDVAFEQLTEQAVRVGRLIGGLMEYLRKTPLKGDKFRGAGQSRQRETRNAERKTA